MGTIPRTCDELSALLGRLVDQHESWLADEDAATGSFMCHWSGATSDETIIVTVWPEDLSDDEIAGIRRGESERYAGDTPRYSVVTAPRIDDVGAVVVANADNSDDWTMSFKVVTRTVTFGVIAPTELALDVAARLAEGVA